eukprot:tig00000144_g9149.t1
MRDAFCAEVLRRAEPHLPYRPELPQPRRARKPQLLVPGLQDVIAIQQTFREPPPNSLFRAQAMTQQEAIRVYRDRGEPVPSLITHTLSDVQFSLPEPPSPRRFRPPPVRKIPPLRASRPAPGASAEGPSSAPARFREPTTSWERREQAANAARLRRRELLYGPGAAYPPSPRAPAPAPPARPSASTLEHASPRGPSPRSAGGDSPGPASDYFDEPEPPPHAAGPPRAFDESMVVRTLAAALAASDDAAFLAAYDDLVPADMLPEEVERLKERARLLAGENRDEAVLRKLRASAPQPGASGSPPAAQTKKKKHAAAAGAVAEARAAGSRRSSPKERQQRPRAGPGPPGPGPAGRRRSLAIALDAEPPRSRRGSAVEWPFFRRASLVVGLARAGRARAALAPGPLHAHPGRPSAAAVPTLDA